MVLGKKKVVLFIGILLLLGLFSFIGWKIYKKRISADVNKTPSIQVDLSHYYANGQGFVPGEVIVKLKSSNNVTTQSASTNLQKKKYLGNKVAVKQIQEISKDNLKIDFNMNIDIKNAVVSTSATNNPTVSTTSTSSIPLTDLKKKVSEKQRKLFNQSGLTLKDIMLMKLTKQISEELKKDPRVEEVYLNHIYQVYGLPNDTYINPSRDRVTWSKGAWGQPYQDMWNLKQTGVANAWTISTGNNVIVAVLDTGVDYTHEDLNNNILTKDGRLPRADGSNVYGADFAYDFTLMDLYGHGTHVAGIIAAKKNNGKGIAGVAPSAKIMPVKVLNSDGYGTESWIAQGIRYAVDNRAKIINMSLGGYGESKIINDALDYAKQNNVVVVVAAGNESWDLSLGSPSSNNNVIAVGASNEVKNNTFFTNFGDNLSVMAPGGGKQIGTSGETWQDLVRNNPNINNIISLYAKDSYIGKGMNEADKESNMLIGDKYIRLAGTSMASPFVAGVAALVLSKNPNLTPDQVKSIICRSATDIIDPYHEGRRYPGWDAYSGYGLVNPEKAITTAATPVPKTEISGPKIVLRSESNFSNSNSSYQIKGTASGTNFKKYTISYAKSNFERVDFYPTRWNVVKTSTTQVNNNLLANIPTSYFSDDNYPVTFIKLEVETNDGFKKVVTQYVILGKGQVNGFPKFVNQYIWESIPVDINNDGKKELIIVDDSLSTHAYRENGTLINYWESGLNEDIGYYSPTVVNDANLGKLIVFEKLMWVWMEDWGDYTLKFGLSAFQANEGIRGGEKWSVTYNYDDLSESAQYNGFSIQVIKANNKEFTVVNLRDRLEIYGSDGTLKKKLNMSIDALAVGNVDNDINGWEEIVYSGYHNINGEVRGGIFALNLQNWQRKNIYLLNSRESNNSYISDIYLADFDKDKKVDFALNQISGTENKLLIVKNNGDILNSKSYPNSLMFENGLPAFHITNIADSDNNNIPEIGIYNYDGDTYDYINSNMERVNQVKPNGRCMPLTVADINQDSVQDIIMIRSPGMIYGFDTILSIYNSSNFINNYNMIGMASEYPNIWVSSGRIRHYNTAFTPWGILLHSFDFGRYHNKKFDWPYAYGHDLRRTFNYETPQTY